MSDDPRTEHPCETCGGVFVEGSSFQLTRGLKRSVAAVVFKGLDSIKRMLMTDTSKLEDTPALELIRKLTFVHIGGILGFVGLIAALGFGCGKYYDDGSKVMALQAHHNEVNDLKDQLRSTKQQYDEASTLQKLNTKQYEIDTKICSTDWQVKVDEKQNDINRLELELERCDQKWKPQLSAKDNELAGLKLEIKERDIKITGLISSKDGELAKEWIKVQNELELIKMKRSQLDDDRKQFEEDRRRLIDDNVSLKKERQSLLNVIDISSGQIKALFETKHFELDNKKVWAFTKLDDKGTWVTTGLDHHVEASYTPEDRKKIEQILKQLTDILNKDKELNKPQKLKQ
jgi:hypothetical protein